MANYLYKPITEMPGNSGKSASASGMTRFEVNKRRKIRKDGNGGTSTTPTPKPLAPSTPRNLSTGPMEAAKAGALRNQPAPTIKQQVQQLVPQGNLMQAPQQQATRQAQMLANATPTPPARNPMDEIRPPHPRMPSQQYSKDVLQNQPPPSFWDSPATRTPTAQSLLSQAQQQNIQATSQARDNYLRSMATPTAQSLPSMEPFQNAWYNNLNNKRVQNSYTAMGFDDGGQAQMANQNGYLVGQVGNPEGSLSLSQYRPGYGRGSTYKSMKKSQGAKMSNMRKGINWGKITSGILDAGSDAAYAARAMARAARSPEVRAAVVDAARGVKAGAKQVGSTMGEAVRTRRAAQTPPIVEVIAEAPKKKRVRSSGKASTPPVVTPTAPTGSVGSTLGAADVDVGSMQRTPRSPLQMFVARTYGRLAGLPYEGLARVRQGRAAAAGKAASEAREAARKLVADARLQSRSARSWDAKRTSHEADQLAALTSAGKIGNEAAEAAANFYPKARNTAAILAALGGGYAATNYFGKRMNKGLRKGNSEGNKKMNGAALAAMLMNTGRGTAEGIRSGGYEAQSIGPREQTRLLNMLMQMQSMLVRDPENPKMNPERKPSAPRSPMKAPNYGNSGGVSDPENPYFSAKTPGRRSSNTGQGGMKKRFSKGAGSMNPSALAAMLMATGRGTPAGIRYGGYEAQSVGPRMQDQRLRMLMQRSGIIRDPENEQYMPMPTRTMTPPRRPTTTPQTRIDPSNPYYNAFATMTRTPTATPFPNTSKRMSKSISNIQQGSTKHVVGGYRGAMGKSFYKSAAARPTQATKNHRSSKFGI